MQSSRSQQEGAVAGTATLALSSADAVPLGSPTGSCLPQSQGEGGAWVFVLPLGSRRSAGVPGCL